MLVISRKNGESIVIGDNITIKVDCVHRGRIKLSIDAPRDIRVLRKELINRSDVKDVLVEKLNPVG